MSFREDRLVKTSYLSQEGTLRRRSKALSYRFIAADAGEASLPFGYEESMVDRMLVISKTQAGTFNSIAVSVSTMVAAGVKNRCLSALLGVVEVKKDVG